MQKKQALNSNAEVAEQALHCNADAAGATQ
jgi:hypothetical protein